MVLVVLIHSLTLPREVKLTAASISWSHWQSEMFMKSWWPLRSTCLGGLECFYHLPGDQMESPGPQSPMVIGRVGKTRSISRPWWPFGPWRPSCYTMIVSSSSCSHLSCRPLFNMICLTKTSLRWAFLIWNGVSLSPKQVSHLPATLSCSSNKDGLAKCSLMEFPDLIAFSSLVVRSGRKKSSDLVLKSFLRSSTPTPHFRFLDSAAAD